MSLFVALALAQSLNLNNQPILCMDEAAYCRADKLRAFEVNCSGAGITCAQVGGRMTLTVPGGGSGGGYDGGKVGEAFAADASITAQSADTAGVAGVAFSADAAGFAATAGVSSLAYASDAAGFASTAGAASSAFSADASAVAIALAANPADCAANQYASAIAASGDLTCAQVAYAQVSGTPTLYNQTVQDEGGTLTQRGAINFTGAGVACVDDTTRTTCTISGGGSGAPSDATYITQTANGTLTNEQALSSLGTGLMLNTTGTGVVSIKGTNTCTNQFPRSDNASGAWTCASIGTADLPTVPVTKGGTGLATVASNQVFVGTAADTVTAKTIPSCSNATTSKLLYDNATQTFSCGTDQTGGGGLTVQTARTTGTHTVGSTTATEITALQVSLAGAGTYDVQYNLRTRSSNATNGYKYGVNVTANLSSLNCVATHSTSGTTAANGVGDGVAAVLTGSLYEVLGATSSASTTAANMGPNTGVTVTTDTVQVRIVCSIVTSGAGDLELWMGSEAAVNVTNEANSYVIVTTIP